MTVLQRLPRGFFTYPGVGSARLFFSVLRFAAPSDLCSCCKKLLSPIYFQVFRGKQEVALDCRLAFFSSFKR